MVIKDAEGNVVASSNPGDFVDWIQIPVAENSTLTVERCALCDSSRNDNEF